MEDMFDMEGFFGMGAGDNASEPDSAGALATLIKGGIITFDPTAATGLGVKPPYDEPIVLYEDLRVAGTTHVEGIDGLVAGLSVGSELRFVREPDNLHDQWAIKVYAGENRLGYVPADSNEVLARLLDGGKRVYGKVCATEKIGEWNKIIMEVYLDD